MTNKKVLIMGYEGFGAVNRLAPIVRKRGYEIVTVVNKGCSHDYRPVSDQIVEVSNIFDPTRACREVFSKINASSVESIICQPDILSFTFAELVRQGKPRRHVSVDQILRCRVKARMRKILKDSHDLHVPFILLSPDTREEDITLKFPFVTKPVGGAGSQMVRKCHSFGQIKDILSETRKHLIEEMPGIENLSVSVDGQTYSLADDILAEEYIAGPEFTIDGFVYRGEVYIVLIQDMFETDDRVDFLDISFITPPIRIDAEGRKNICDHLKKALGLLRYDNAYFHAEMKYTREGPRIVEINPRLSGGVIPRVFEIVSGISADELFVDLSLCNDLDEKIISMARNVKQSNKYVGYYTFFAPKSGLVSKINGIPEVRNMGTLKELVIVVSEGKKVPNIIGKRYLAFAIFEADSPQELIASMYFARNTIRFEII